MRYLAPGRLVGNCLYKPAASGVRQYSTALETLQTTLREELTSRPPNIIYDYISSTSSHLLDVTLHDFLPKWAQGNPNADFDIALDPESVPRSKSRALKPGHHLVYFAPQVSSSGLLPDGTDSLQSPGSPFYRRMWAGGRIRFPSGQHTLQTNRAKAKCIEVISDVVVKGTEGDEKVFVTINRRMSTIPLPEKPGHLRPRLSETDNREPLVPIEEDRYLVFLRKKPITTEDITKAEKVLKPAHEPDVSFTIVPTRELLFRFSALTFNAHAIHLDSQYCREVEGHRNLLVHGPLTLTLMLTALSGHISGPEDLKFRIRDFQYRNLAPLYVGEEMKVCIRKTTREDRVREAKYDVWIEGRGGGYAVKGTAIVEDSKSKDGLT